MTSFLYLMEAQNGLTKIGQSASPFSRAAQYATHSPVPCRLIAVWPGSRSDEREMHRRFAEFRHFGEWFWMRGDFEAFVEQMRGRGLLEEPRSFHSMLWNPNGDAALATRAKRSASMKAAWAQAKANPRRLVLAWREAQS